MSNKTGTKVVVAIDFGHTSDLAIAQALGMARTGALDELHAVYALNPDDIPDGIGEPALLRESDVLGRAPSHLKERVADVAQAMGVPLTGFETFVHARVGKPAESINQVAIDYDADLIVVGTHSSRGLDRLLLGSVSEKVVRSAHCPVLVARAKDYSGLSKTERIAPPLKGAPPQRDETFDVPLHRSTQRVSWSPTTDSDGPTGYRIV